MSTEDVVEKKEQVLTELDKAHGAALSEQIDQVIKDQKKVPMMKVQSTKPIKLKDTIGKNLVKFNLVETFGFVPEEMVIKKVQGANNFIIISAVVPDRVLLQEEKRAEAKKKKNV